MLKTRNLLAHDYDGIIAKKNFRAIISNYYDAFDGLKDAITKFYDGSLLSIDGFDQQLNSYNIFQFLFTLYFGYDMLET